MDSDPNRPVFDIWVKGSTLQSGSLNKSYYTITVTLGCHNAQTDYDFCVSAIVVSTGGL